MNYYYITGTSRGIGKAFAEQLLEDPSNNVIGLSRQNTIEHGNYRHFYLDLTDMKAIADSLNQLVNIVLIQSSGITRLI